MFILLCEILVAGYLTFTISSIRKFWKKKTISNLGYAFVNFTSAVGALRYYKAYHKSVWSEFTGIQSPKICEISCAKIQVIRFAIRFLPGFCFPITNIFSLIHLGVLHWCWSLIWVLTCRVSRHWGNGSEAKHTMVSQTTSCLWSWILHVMDGGSPTKYL